MRIVFIRHGTTQSNIEKRFVGITDDPLCDFGIRELCANVQKKIYPEVSTVISSPLQRCIQTAELIYPDKSLCLDTDLQECHFGDFEGKNHNDLCNNADYQRWLSAEERTGFPNGETYAKFKERCIKGVLRNIERFKECDSLAFVTHGGTIMTVLETLARPKKGFYDYILQNGCGYLCRFANGILQVTEEIQ